MTPSTPTCSSLADRKGPASVFGFTVEQVGQSLWGFFGILKGGQGRIQELTVGQGNVSDGTQQP